MTKCNERLRDYMTQHGIMQWQVAESLGVSESVVCRKLRHELSESETTQFMAAVNSAIDRYKERNK